MCHAGALATWPTGSLAEWTGSPTTGSHRGAAEGAALVTGPGRCATGAGIAAQNGIGSGVGSRQRV